MLQAFLYILDFVCTNSCADCGTGSLQLCTHWIHRDYKGSCGKEGLVNKSRAMYVYIIDQARGQDSWILAEFSFCVFMDGDKVEVHKNTKREQGQYPAIFTKLAWSIKDLLHDIKSNGKK